MIEAATELLKNLPTWVQAILLLPVFGMMFFVKPAIDAFNSWKTNRAETRKINVETDLKLIEEYKDFLTMQHIELDKLQAENKRLHDITDGLARDAEKLHGFVKACLVQLHDLGVPTDQMPVIPDLSINQKASK